MELKDFEQLIRARAKDEKSVGNWPNKEEAVKQFERIRPHVEVGYYPEALFKERAPNQTPEQQAYTKATYKSTTHPVFQDYMTVLNKMWIDGNWQIVWPENAFGDDGMMKYCTEKLPKWRSVEYFMKSIYMPKRATDANGITAVRPSHFEFKEVDGQMVVDDTKRYTPTIYTHPSTHIITFTDNLVVAIDLEKSPVIGANGKVVKEGEIIYAYTPETIYRAKQVGKKADKKYEVIEYFRHGEGVMPCVQNGGVPMIGADGQILWISQFYFAVALLDIALVDMNWLQHMKANCVFPFRIVDIDECGFQDDRGKCSNGLFVWNEEGKMPTTCPSCHGRGQRVPISPLGEYQRRIPNKLDGDNAVSDVPVKYVEPSVESVTFIDNQVTQNMARAGQMLHIRTSNSSVKGSEDMTATGMALDHQVSQGFIKSISDPTFLMYEWLLARISWQRYDNYDQVPTLVWPQHFDFRTEADMWAQVKLATESEAPPAIRQTLFSDLLNTKLASDPEFADDYSVLMMADRLFALTSTEIAARVAQRVAEPWQVTLHDAGLQLLAELKMEANWADLAKTEKVAKLVDLAKTLTFVPQSQTAPDLLGQILNR